MAVYKETFCYPFANAIDIRVAQDVNDIQPIAQCLTCKIETSNKNITGYSVRILTDGNEQVFPVTSSPKISPISELQIEALGYDSDDPWSINSGKNGTSLKIPFFQGANSYKGGETTRMTTSYNAVYYKPFAHADHLIVDPDEALAFIYPTRDITDMEDVANWTTGYEEVEKYNYLSYDWPSETEAEKKRNLLMVDGEALISGDTVLVTGDYTKNGLYVVASLDGQTILKQVYLTSYTDMEIVITKGTSFHNSIWKSAGASNKLSYVTSTTSQWTDCAGTEIPLLNCNSSNYKWELTLYQGTIKGGQTPSQGGSPAYCDYTDLDKEYLDMTVTSGTIMGSTPERLQLTSSVGAVGTVPKGTDTDPLVLQDTYVELTNSNSTIAPGGTRAPVQTYDSTYGHAYPMADYFTENNIKNNTYCQFFQHTTNQDEILDTDMVNFCFSSNVVFKYYILSNNKWNTSYAGDQAGWLANSRTQERYIVLDNTVITDNNLNVGDLILFTGQDRVYQNGVYMLYSTSGTNGSVATSYYNIKRAASYDTWAEYIGKIIYCVNGTAGTVRNYECLASGGAYTLWNPLNTVSGTSALIFTPERPILLFRNLLHPQTVTLFNSQNSAGGPISTDPNNPTTFNYTTVDGFTVLPNDVIAFADRYYGIVQTVESNRIIMSAYGSGQFGGNEYMYVTSGNRVKTGSPVLWWNDAGSSATPTWILHTAKLCKNTTTCTYISPWSNLQKGMQLQLLYNQYVYNTDTNPKPLQMIPITSYVEGTYCVYHQAITSVSGGSEPIPSYSSEVDSPIPWSYNIKSFFTVSDENPFVSYETPYIRLYKNGSIYSDISLVGGMADFVVTDSGAGPSNRQILQDTLKDEEGTVIAHRIVAASDYVAQTSITGRYIRLGATYVQFGQSSWESYRWVLYNSDGDIVQDTGKKYNKDINVMFYGVSNDTTLPIQYTVVLYLENDFGDNLEFSLDLTVAPGEASAFLTPDPTTGEAKEFTATFDCSTHSNIIHFDGVSSTPGYKYSIYRREYEVYKRPGEYVYGYYCKPGTLTHTEDLWGKFFEDSFYTKEITAKSVHKCYIDMSKSGNNNMYLYNPSGQYEFGPDPVAEYRIYTGEWEPALVQSELTWFRDFNISNHRSYQYIIYPAESKVLEAGKDTVQQTMANYDGEIWYVDPVNSLRGSTRAGAFGTSIYNGAPVVSNWNCWSIAELIPETLAVDAPIARKQYRVDDENIWLFKYQLETGTQTQNISRDEFQSLGTYPKFGFGSTDYASGDVSAYMGSEILPCSKYKYIERLPLSRITPLSSNERAQMLKQWQSFVYSKNPKLLKDMKGQSWIVQITSSSSTPNNTLRSIPDKLSFQWKQVDSVKNVIIYGNYSPDDTPEVASQYNISQSVGAEPWTKVFGRNI